MSGGLRALWGRWEHPRSLAFLRIAIATVILGDLAHLWLTDLVPFLFQLPPEGIASDRGVWLEPLLPGGAARAWMMWGLVAGAATLFGLGVATPISAVALLLLYTQLGDTYPIGDRGIDRMLRNCLLILVFSRCGAAYSLDAWRRTGRWRGDGAAVPAWPRHLIVFQLVVMYLSAGLHKAGAAWSMVGDYSALFYVLENPGLTRWEWAWRPAYGLTQAVTVATLVWEFAAPIVLLGFWYRHTAHRGGRLRRWFARLRPDRLWVLGGVAFHLGIAFFLTLGLFPWGMLALYPAFVHPDRWPRTTPTQSPPRRTGHLKAGALTGVAFIIFVHALPWPRPLRAGEIRLREAQVEVDAWLPLVRRLGVAETREEAWAFAVKWSRRLNDVQRALERPFAPLFRYTGTGQHWHLFATPNSTVHRMVVEGFDAAGAGRVLFRMRDAEHDWGEEIFRQRRLRPVFAAESRRHHPHYDQAARRLAGLAFAEHPELALIRFTHERRDAVRPPAPPDPRWTVSLTRTYPRPR